MQLSPLERQQLHVAQRPRTTFWHRVRFDLVHRHAVQLGSTSVLDVGAGSGLLGHHLASARPPLDYRFTESSAVLRDALVDSFGPDALVPDDGPIPATLTVAVLDVIEHVEDDAALLSGLARRMEPGTGLIVTVPAMRWLFSSWDVDLGHFRRYDRSDAASVVTGAGFEVIEVAYLFPELVPPAALRRVRRSDGATADFPDLPAWVDRTAETISSATARFRRRMPIGTSVLVVARRSAAAGARDR